MLYRQQNKIPSEKYVETRRELEIVQQASVYDYAKSQKSRNTNHRICFYCNTDSSKF